MERELANIACYFSIPLLQKIQHPVIPFYSSTDVEELSFYIILDSYIEFPVLSPGSLLGDSPGYLRAFPRCPGKSPRQTGKSLIF